MSLVLSLEQGPRAQPVRQMRLAEGRLVIGRGTDADWRIDDPDMFVSRRHCTITGGAEGYTVTDNSAGGLYIDEARSPLGAGNSTPLRNGMRLRLGDFVLRVAIAAEQPLAPLLASPSPPPPGAPPPARSQPELDSDDFFSMPVPREPTAARPSGLPRAFEKPVASPYFAPEPAPPDHPAPPQFDDPFTLDPIPTPPAAPAGFDWTDPSPQPPAAAPAAGGFDWGALPAEAAPPDPAPSQTAAPASPPVADLRDAFLRGLGLDPAEIAARDPVAQMEAFGRDYRLMLEGLMHLLRKRAQEKGNARIAQTIVGASEVNPLKFLPTIEDVLVTLLAERSPGFLGPEAAITGAVRDLAQHHVDAWHGVQSALAAMIRRFDPAALEEELKAHSTLETLLAGGRRAKLWELYEERYREIARSAENRFLGEVGADFREAYENSKGDRS